MIYEEIWVLRKGWTVNGQLPKLKKLAVIFANERNSLVNIRFDLIIVSSILCNFFLQFHLCTNIHTFFPKRLQKIYWAITAHELSLPSSEAQKSIQSHTSLSTSWFPKNKPNERMWRPQNTGKIRKNFCRPLILPKFRFFFWNANKLETFQKSSKVKVVAAVFFVGWRRRKKARVRVKKFLKMFLAVEWKTLKGVEGGLGIQENFSASANFTCCSCKKFVIIPPKLWPNEFVISSIFKEGFFENSREKLFLLETFRFEIPPTFRLFIWGKEDEKVKWRIKLEFKLESEKKFLIKWPDKIWLKNQAGKVKGSENFIT